MSKIRKFNNNDQDDDGGNGEDDDENYEDILIFKLIGPPGAEKTKTFQVADLFQQKLSRWNARKSF